MGLTQAPTQRSSFADNAAGCQQKARKGLAGSATRLLAGYQAGQFPTEPGTKQRPGLVGKQPVPGHLDTLQHAWLLLPRDAGRDAVRKAGLEPARGLPVRT